MKFYDHLENLISAKGLNLSQLAEELGLPKQTIYSWRDGTLPRYEQLVKIADYFNISLDELTGRTPPQHTEQEIKLLHMFSKLSSEDKQTIMVMVDYLSSK